MRTTPDLPALNAAHVSSMLKPIGVIKPMPVITTRRFDVSGEVLEWVLRFFVTYQVPPDSFCLNTTPQPMRRSTMQAFWPPKPKEFESAESMSFNSRMPSVT